MPLTLLRSRVTAPGDEWGEIDTRFSYCAVYSLAKVPSHVSPIGVLAAIINLDIVDTPGGESLGVPLIILITFFPTHFIERNVTA